MPQADAISTTTPPEFDPFALGGDQDPKYSSAITSEQSLLIRQFISAIWSPGCTPECTTFVITLPAALATRFFDEVIDKVDFDDFEDIEQDAFFDAETALLWRAINARYRHKAIERGTIAVIEQPDGTRGTYEAEPVS